MIKKFTVILSVCLIMIIGAFGLAGCNNKGLIYELSKDGQSYIVVGLFDNKEKEIVIPSVYDDKPVTAIKDRAFYNCFSLTSITIPDSVTSIGEKAFYNCDSLSTIQIPDGVTSIGNGAFYDCDLLSDVVLPKNLTAINTQVFHHCNSLAAIQIPDAVTVIGEDAFSYDIYLTSVTFGENSNLETINVNAFRNCHSLQMIKLPKSVRFIKNRAFDYCSSLNDIEIPDSVSYINADAFGFTAYYHNAGNWFEGGLYIGNHLVDVAYNTIGEFNVKEGTKTIACEAFSSCFSVSSVTIPSSVLVIGKGALAGCRALESVSIGEGVTEIGIGAFNKCTALENIEYKGTVEQWGALNYGESPYDWENVPAIEIVCSDGGVSVAAENLQRLGNN